MSTKKQQAEFISDIIALKHRAMKLGLWMTFHAIDKAVKEVGFEAASLRSKKLKKGLI